MKAILVTFDIMVRAVVHDAATEDEIKRVACDKLRAMHADYAENIVEIKDDTDVPAHSDDEIDD